MSAGWLIVGADGLLGGTLRQHWREQNQPVAATSFLPLEDTRDLVHLDLSQPSDAWPVLPLCRSAVLCAAITSLDQCRRDPTGTRRINVEQTLRLADKLVSQGTFVVFVSSNLVFDGSKPLRQPQETPCPMTEYGRQKAEAEADLAQFGPRAAVVRLTKVVHPGLPLIAGWRKTLAKGQPIQAFSDFICAPITLAPTIASIAAVAEQQLPGIWQLSSSADISYAGMAERLAERWHVDPTLIQAIPSSERVTLEHLPRFSTLEATESQRKLGFKILDPTSVIDEISAP